MFELWKSAVRFDKNQRYFDEGDIPYDVWQVLTTASLLSIGEFRVFEIAYQNWYGETADEEFIEKHFVSYMFNDVVPFWVKHLCNKVEQLEQSGKLNTHEFGNRERQPKTEQHDRGFKHLFWFAGAMLIYLALLIRFVSGA